MYRCLKVYWPFLLGSVLGTPIEIEIADGDWMLISVGKALTLTIVCGLYWYMVDSRRTPS